jgi:multiple sugar transport system ATP-binding protein
VAQVLLEAVSRQIDGNRVIDNISFQVPDGEFWVLVGPSGCGKSTILRTIAGLEPVQQGQLYIGDRLVNGVPARQRDVAMVFQNYALYPHMTVAQNLAFGLKMRQANPDTIRQQVTLVAQSLDIAHLLDRKPRQLSGGQQQRVALGRAIARQPQAFLLDEPLSNLDAQLRDDTRAELKLLHQRFGITTLYVTHDQIEAMTLADQVVVLSQGQVQQVGPPQAVYARPANRMVATFLGSPPMNVVEASFDGQQFRIDGQTLPCPPALAQHLAGQQNSRVSLGFRPEAITLASDPAAAQLRLTVSLVEPLGRETLVRGVIPSDRTVAQTVALQAPPHCQPHPGDSLAIEIDPASLFVFAGDGRTLYPP